MSPPIEEPKSPQDSLTIILARTVTKTAPDLHGQGPEFHRGDRLRIGLVQWPGKPRADGSTNPDWSFWTSPDITQAAIFERADVNHVEAPDTPDWKEVLKGAPFVVVFLPPP